MLAKRIIPCLDIKNGRTVKGIKFKQLRDAGDPVELGALYAEQSADELCFLDITATIEKRAVFAELVKRIAANINVPFTVGGGINSVKDVAVLLNAGADKITINSSAVKNPDLIGELADMFGSQCIVLAIDSGFFNKKHTIYTHGGRVPIDIETEEWAEEIYNRGAGEILLTSMTGDGTKKGYDLEIIEKVCRRVNIPVIASGGAGKFEHFRDVFDKTGADAALAASVFHFKDIAIPELKRYLSNNNIIMR